MNDRDKSCEERIGERLKDSTDRWRRLFNVIDADSLNDVTPEDIVEAFDDARPSDVEPTSVEAIEVNGQSYTLDELKEKAQESMQTEPLSTNIVKVVRIDLSTGGPADWLELRVDSDGDVIGGAYVFQDWFDGARRELKLAERFGNVVYPIDSLGDD